MIKRLWLVLSIAWGAFWIFVQLWNWTHGAQVDDWPWVLGAFAPLIVGPIIWWVARWVWAGRRRSE